MAIETFQETDFAEGKPLSFVFAYLGKKCNGSLKKNLYSVELERYPYALWLICKVPEITQQTLVRLLEIDKAMVARVVDFLVETDLVSRKVNPVDKREHFIIPTEKALTYASKIEQAFDETNAIALKGFSELEIVELKKMLNRIQNNLADLPLIEK